jgi:signal transduction histidine kinase
VKPGIFFLRPGREHEIWIGLWTSGLYWLNTQRGVLHYFSKDTLHGSFLKSNALISGFADGDDFWVGYNGGFGFSKYSRPENTWSHYNPRHDEGFNSNSGTISAITKDPKNRVWIGTHGGGVFRFDQKTNTYIHYGQTQGLNSNYINSILSDTAGNLWISTSDGMNYLDQERNVIRSLNMDLVFPDNDLRPNGIQGVDGKFYFFYQDQFIEVSPWLYQTNRQPLPMALSSFTVLDQEKIIPDPGSPVQLSYKENFFSFGFSMIKSDPMKKVNYAYQLVGFDKDWIPTSRPYVQYTNVPEGHYRFQVKAMNEAGDWSAPLLDLDIRIKPPFWRTWWFISLCIVLLAAGVHLFYRYRIGQVKKLLAVRAKISRDLHDEVGSALSSIHVYSTVATKTMQKNPEVSQDALKMINVNSKQVMENMSDIVWAINTGPQSGISLEKKLKNYGFELLTPLGISTKYSIDHRAEQQLIHIEARKNVLLIAKEAMNNIARYSKASEAVIQVGLADHHLILHVEDNGVGFDTQNRRSGNGLFNMQKRTESMGGRFLLTSSAGRGTVISCRIPLPNIRDI